MTVGFPWQAQPKSDEAEQVISECPLVLSWVSHRVPQESPASAVRALATRHMCVKRADLDPEKGRIGHAEACLGCRSLVFGTARVGHNEICRAGASSVASAAGAGPVRAKAARDREVEYLASKLGKENRKKRLRANSDGPGSSSSPSFQPPNVVRSPTDAPMSIQPDTSASGACVDTIACSGYACCAAPWPQARSC